MPTETFNYTGNTQTWTVPSNVVSVYATLRGGEGSAAESPPGLGGRVEGYIPVTPGETLYLTVGQAAQGESLNDNQWGNGGWPNGGDTTRILASGSSEDADAQGGAGGGSSDIRKGGNSISDIIGLAGGGGGGADNDDRAWNGQEDNGDGGGGGGQGEDGEDGTSSDGDVSEGGEGGGSGSFYGEDSEEVEDDDSDLAGAHVSGAGGGGLNGGAAGRASYPVSGGGGGGDGTTSGLNGASSFVDTNPGNGEIVLTYTVTIPQNLQIVHDAAIPEATLSWEVPPSFVDSDNNFNIYRGTSAGVSTTSGNRIATVDGTNRSYTDSGVQLGEEYYYTMDTTNVHTGNTSGASAEESQLVAAFIRLYESGDYNTYPVKYWDSDSGSHEWAPVIKTWNEDTDSWDESSNL